MWEANVGGRALAVRVWKLTIEDNAMRNKRLMVLGMWLLGGLCAAAAGQDLSAEKMKLLAKRSAEADAYRKLAEAVYGMQINSRTFVEDFVAQSDEIRGEVDTFVKGVRLGTPTWYEDYSCEVPAEVTVAKVIETLRTAHSRHYDGDDIEAGDFESMTRRIEKRVIKAIGMGAPRVDLPPDLPIGVTEQLGPPPADAPQAPYPEIWRTLGPRGVQARLMAQRAARLDAIRKLAERIKGLRLTSKTMVRDFVTESDIITTDLMTHLNTAGEETSTYYHSNELIVEVTMRMPTEQVITTIKRLHSRYYDGDDVEGHDVEKITKRVVKKDFEATGMGIPPAKYIQAYEQAAQVELPGWAEEYVTATGTATDPAFGTPQGRLKAIRAAEVDAKRKLIEKIHGLTIRSETKVEDFVTQYDHVAAAANGFIVDATILESNVGADSATVTVGVPGLRVWEVVNEELRRQQRH